MERVLTELTPECEITARMYAQGYEKKEIADLKCRAVSTINNQLQKAFEVLQLRNGRELATLVFERISGYKFNDELFTHWPYGGCLLSIMCVFFFALSRTRRYEKRKKNESGTNRKNKEVL